MVEAAFVLRLHEKPSLADEQRRQIHGLVGVVGRAIGLEAVDSQLARGMDIPTRLGPKRLVMTTVAIGFAAKQFVTPPRRRRVEINPRSRFGSGKGELVIVQRG